ncbi:unnamed protein product [Phytophthora fragariaefolia]|uniref:Unnamed protein product n=1 Tax=Phytophthora fragariaefolia TaxID=1490495 RepID=A0A9W6XEE4_9STRA|nr:unnamed protein product [Phytophthora fragariaefolia]
MPAPPRLRSSPPRYRESGRMRYAPGRDRGTRLRRSGRKSNPSRKKRPGRDLSPDSSDPSSDSDEGDSDSSSWSDSSGKETSSSTKTSSKAKVGSTLLTIRPYVNPNSLETFDEKASLGDRRSWWERFLNMTEQGGWTDKVKLSRLRMKISSAVRNWRGQLPKHVQADWKKPSREFRHKYLKTRTSESERYFTTKQKSGETPLEFPYRLKEAAVNAGIKYKSPASKRAQHIKCFMKSLRDKQLKVILVNQRFHDVDDVGYAPQQDDYLAQEGDYDTPPPKPHDFRADNVTQDVSSRGVQDVRMSSRVTPSQ